MERTIISIGTFLEDLHEQLQWNTFKADQHLALTSTKPHQSLQQMLLSQWLHFHAVESCLNPWCVKSV